MFGTPFATFSKELISVSVTRSQYKVLRTHMRIKHLNLSKSRVRKHDACSGLAYKPVTSHDIKRGTVQRVGMYSRGNYWKSREYCKTCSEGTAATETVRGVVQGRLYAAMHL